MANELLQRPLKLLTVFHLMAAFCFSGPAVWARSPESKRAKRFTVVGSKVEWVRVRNLEIGKRKMESGKWKWNGKMELGTSNWELRTGNLELGTWNWELGTRSLGGGRQRKGDLRGTIWWHRERSRAREEREERKEMEGKGKRRKRRGEGSNAHLRLLLEQVDGAAAAVVSDPPFSGAACLASQGWAAAAAGCHWLTRAWVGGAE